MGTFSRPLTAFEGMVREYSEEEEEKEEVMIFLSLKGQP